MANRPLKFFNRYTQSLEVERIYGEPWLRWAYGNPLGRASVWAIASRSWFSHYYGWRMSKKASASRIGPFLTDYDVDREEMELPTNHYESFNAFFYRRLKPSARPIDADPSSVVFPADGRHLGFADYAAAGRFFVKGEQFSLADMLGDSAEAKRYEHGTVVLSRLCPVDYHRFHFPITGTPEKARLIAGKLYSVSPIALKRSIDFLTQNKRMLTPIESIFGRVWQIEIGATNVGSIQQTFTPGKLIQKGAEKGHFRFGGSAVMTIYPPGTVELEPDLLKYSDEGIELYARMGDCMGKIRQTMNRQIS